MLRRKCCFLAKKVYALHMKTKYIRTSALAMSSGYGALIRPVVIITDPKVSTEYLFVNVSKFYTKKSITLLWNRITSISISNATTRLGTEYSLVTDWKFRISIISTYYMDNNTFSVPYLTPLGLYLFLMKSEIWMDISFNLKLLRSETLITLYCSPRDSSR